MDPENRPLGFKLRYLPGIYGYRFAAALESDPHLTKEQFAASLKDQGEVYAVRVYRLEDGCDFVILGRLNDLSIPKSNQGKAVDVLPEKILKEVFENNSEVLRFKGIAEFDPSEVQAMIYGLPIEVYLSQFWCLLEKTELYEIGVQSFTGTIDTDQGTLPLHSL